MILAMGLMPALRARTDKMARHAEAQLSVGPDILLRIEPSAGDTQLLHGLAMAVLVHRAPAG
jgi:hypothetical protein